MHLTVRSATSRAPCSSRRPSDDADRIRELNDAFRTTFIGGRVFITRRVPGEGDPALRGRGCRQGVTLTCNLQGRYVTVNEG